MVRARHSRERRAHILRKRVRTVHSLLRAEIDKIWGELIIICVERDRGRALNREIFVGLPLTQNRRCRGLMDNDPRVQIKFQIEVD